MARCSDHAEPAVFSAEALPNGALLPTPWPPTHLSYLNFTSDPPQPLPNPATPPPVVRITVGRQLFVDDFLIERASNLARRFHQAKVQSMGVLVPDQPWEQTSGDRKTARPFGGGTLLDPRSQRLLLWYRCGWRGASGKTCVALSRDGVHFTKPQLTSSPIPGSNVVLETRQNEAFEVVYDFAARPPRFVAMRMEWMTGGVRTAPYTLYSSFDGVAWRSHADRATGVMADRSTFFLNPLRASRKPVWVFSLRENLCAAGPSGHMRARRYWETPHDRLLDRPGAARLYRPFVRAYFQCAAPRAGEPVAWLAVDRGDCGFARCDLYNVDGVAYESVLLHGLAVLCCCAHDAGQGSRVRPGLA